MSIVREAADVVVGLPAQEAGEDLARVVMKQQSEV